MIQQECILLNDQFWKGFCYFIFLWSYTAQLYFSAAQKQTEIKTPWKWAFGYQPKKNVSAFRRRFWRVFFLLIPLPLCFFWHFWTLDLRTTHLQLLSSPSPGFMLYIFTGKNKNTKKCGPFSVCLLGLPLVRRHWRVFQWAEEPIFDCEIQPNMISQPSHTNFDNILCILTTSQNI